MAMRRSALCLAVATTLSAAPVLAVEMSAESRRDLSCLIIYADAGNAIKDQTEDQKIGFSTILAYFYGKILSRNGAFDFKAALTPEMMQAARTTDQVGRQACDEEVTAFADAFTAAAVILDK